MLQQELDRQQQARAEPNKKSKAKFMQNQIWTDCQLWQDPEAG